MHRKPLLDQLSVYRARDSREAGTVEELRRFVEANADCFERSLRIGHVTGSAWILDGERTHALLTHHRKLNKWLQLGGHADGDPDMLRVAMREAREESSLAVIQALSEQIFDVDIHIIPVFIGEGIPLVAPRHRDIPLRLRSSKKCPDGVVQLRYEVAR